MQYVVRRFDGNKENVTFGMWVRVAEFLTRESADAYVKRASSRTQLLRVDVEGDR